MTRILLSAAEPSADRYVARLVPALRTTFPGAEIEAIGGPLTAAAGATVIHDMADLQAFGLVEAARGLGTHLRLYRDLEAACRRGAWDVIVLCDYPGWHLRLGGAARRAGVPVLYYVAPQLWAWGAWRVATLRQAADRVAVVLPFEESFFTARGVAARFVGHPLLDERRPTRDAARRAMGLEPGTTVVAVLPGARPDDIRRHWPTFHDAVALLRRDRDVRVVVGGMPGATYGEPDGTVMASGGAAALAAADVALVKSGTATLEAALADVPAVVSYRLHPVTWWIARRAVQVPWVSLASLVAGRQVHPELLQRRARADALARALGDLLDDASTRAAQRAGYAIVRQRMGTSGAADRVARLAGELAA